MAAIQDVFNETMLAYFGAETGAFTGITNKEIEKQTYNVKASVRKMLYQKIGKDNIPSQASPGNMTFKLSPNLKDEFDKASIELKCKFSKPDKEEITLYFSSKDFISKEQQKEGDVWCIYFKAGDSSPWFGFFSKDAWDVFYCPYVNDLPVEQEEITRTTSGSVKKLVYSCPVSALSILEINPPAKAVKRHGRRIRRNSKQKIITTKDMKTIQQNNKAKGIRGEEIALRIEKERLTNLGRADLAGKVKWIAKKYDGLGYDIESNEIDPVTNKYHKIYIEVKSTSGGPDSAFYISETERFVSTQMDENYYIYRIFGMTPGSNEIGYYRVSGAVESNFALSPSNYIASRI